MSKCPAIYEHPEFKKSYDPNNSRQKKEVEKLKRFLASDVGHQIGESLKYKEFIPFKSFPRGNTDIRILFILCKDCNKKTLEPKCDFCAINNHSMDDAVLFYVGDHKDVYEKEGKKLVGEYK